MMRQGAYRGGCKQSLRLCLAEWFQSKKKACHHRPQAEVIWPAAGWINYKTGRRCYFYLTSSWLNKKVWRCYLTSSWLNKTGRLCYLTSSWLNKTGRRCYLTSSWLNKTGRRCYLTSSWLNKTSRLLFYRIKDRSTLLFDQPLVE